MNHKLSIIIPCYNCEQTLEEAVASVYVQNLSIPFEVVMVNDGSTDGTKKLMSILERKYLEIKIYHHEKNKGGGATRNTAVKNTTGDLIFCLDSDDILPDNMLQKMIDYLDNKNCDGVLFNESRYFINNINNTKSSSFNILSDEAYNLSDLFDNKGWLTLVNFLYTKDAFKIAGGYPENHGFDTQSFGFRFLSRGLKVYTCPDAFYFHRQASNKKKSYFDRTYEDGLFSINLYLMLEDIMYLFSENLLNKIIKYDILSNNKLGSNNLDSFIKNEYEKNGDQIFIKNYRKYIGQNKFSKYITDNEDKDSPPFLFLLAIYNYKNKNYKKAFDMFSKISDKFGNTSIIKFNLVRSKIALEGGINIVEIEDHILKMNDDFGIRSRKIPLLNLKKILIKIPGFVFLLHLLKKIKPKYDFKN